MTRLTDAERARLFDLLDNHGYTVPQIAAALGRPRSTIYGNVRSRKIGRLGKIGRPRKSVALRRRAVALYKGGETLVVICEKLKVHLRWLTHNLAEEHRAGRLEYRRAPEMKAVDVWTGARKLAAARHLAAGLDPEAVANRLTRDLPGARVHVTHIRQFADGMVVSL